MGVDRWRWQEVVQRDLIEGTLGPGRVCAMGSDDIVHGGPGDDLWLVRDGHKDDVRGGWGTDTVEADRGLDCLKSVERLR